jgi:nitroreductase
MLDTTSNREELLKAIDRRISRRAYVASPLNEDTANGLRALMDRYNNAAGLNMWLVVGDGGAFKNARKTYGFFSGVDNYVALVGDPHDFGEEERSGYYGQLLILEATLKGLGTCWVGGTFDRNAVPIALDKGRSVPCVITVGEVEDELSKREKTIKRITKRRGSKPIADMVTTAEQPPDWFTAGMRAVQKAPSAVNRQPVTFSYMDGVVTAAVSDVNADRIWYDLGIAKLHFEIGAGGGTWEWGNNGAFVRGG